MEILAAHRDKRQTEEAVNPKNNEVTVLLNSSQNEFEVTPSFQLTVRKDLIQTGNSQKDDQIIRGLENEYKKISLHNNPETNTPATNDIERIIKETLAKVGKQELGERVKVVILNRTEVLNAFATPDSTIFLTQSLINALGDLDSIMGVVFHELSHIENEDYKKKSSQRYTEEPSADLKYTPRYLDLAGLNTLGLSEALKVLEKDSAKKGTGTGRSEIYQELSQRQLIAISQHFFEHFENDTKETQKAPEFYVKEFNKTNIEILKKLISKNASSEEIAILLKQLSKDDLFRILLDEKFLFNTEIGNLFRERLQAENFTTEQIEFIIFNTGVNFGGRRLNPGYLTSKEEVLKVSRNLEELNGNNLPTNIYLGQNILLQEKSPTNSLVFSTSIRYSGVTFLEGVQTFMRDETRIIPENETFIPLNTEALIEILENSLEYIKKLPDFDSNQTNKLIFNIINDFAIKYLNQDNESLGIFYEKIKNSNLPFEVNRKILNEIKNDRRYENIFLNENKIKAIETLKNLYQIEDEPKEEENKYSTEKLKLELENLVGAENYVIREGLQVILRDLNNYFKKSNTKNETPDNEREEYILLIENFLNSLPLDKYEFFDRYGNTPQNASIIEWVLNGDEGFHSSPLPEFTDEYMKKVKDYSLFNLKLQLYCKLYQSDNETFYQKLTDLMNESQIDFDSLDLIQSLRLIGPLVSISDTGAPSRVRNFGYGPLSFNRTVFEFTTRNPMFGWKEKVSAGISIQNIAKLEELPFMKSFLKKTERNEVQEISISSISKEYERLYSAYYLYNKELFGSDPQNPNNAFNEDLAQNLLYRNIREMFNQLLESTEIDNQNLDELYKLVNSLLPNSTSKNEILHGIKIQLLTSDVEFSKKVEFFAQNSSELNYSDLVLLTEQIKGDPQIPGKYWEEWMLLENSLKGILEDYELGRKSSENLQQADFLSSKFVQGPMAALKTSESSEESSKKQSTLYAKSWLATSIGGGTIGSEAKELFGIEDEGVNLRYDRESGLFTVSNSVREFFKSFSDAVKDLKNIPIEKRMLIVKKALIAERGSLSTEQSRRELAEILRNTLKLENPFLKDFAEIFTVNSVPGSKTRDVFVGLASNFLGNNLFQALNTESIDYEEIEKDYIKTGEIISNYYQFTSADFPRLIESSTEDIVRFGAQYFHADSKLISVLNDESDKQYKRATRILKEKFAKETASTRIETQNLEVSREIETLFRGAESTILGTRCLQIIRQMRRFEDPAIDRRMALSFDANPGMDRFRFLRSLRTAADKDPELQTFLETRLIGITKVSEKRDSLGGGSMATTYKAVISETQGSTTPREVAIRALVPGAELQIRMIADAINETLSVLEAQPIRDGESKSEYRQKIRDLKLARSVVKLATEWCVTDLNDEVYEENDDRFRNETMKLFNSVSRVDRFVAPDRILTSHRNWVRVEGLASGVSARSFLDNPENSPELKAEVVRQIILFNRFQFEQKPKQQDEIVLVQSDPSIGNYLVEIVDGKPKIHVLDRGLMIPMSETRLTMINNLLKGKRIEFLNSFINEIIDYNLEHNPRYQAFTSVQKMKLKTNLILNIAKAVTMNNLFQGARNMIDIVTTVNDTLIEFDLDLPWEIQLPIKNIVGFERLMQDYIKNPKK